jgi:hypothetical protein
MPLYFSQESSRDSAYDGVSSGAESRGPTPVAVCSVLPANTLLTRRPLAQKHMTLKAELQR